MGKVRGCSGGACRRPVAVHVAPRSGRWLGTAAPRAVAPGCLRRRRRCRRGPAGSQPGALTVCLAAQHERAQILDEPKYAVVDAAPSFSKTGARWRRAPAAAAAHLHCCRRRRLHRPPDCPAPTSFCFALSHCSGQLQRGGLDAGGGGDRRLLPARLAGGCVLRLGGRMRLGFGWHLRGRWGRHLCGRASGLPGAAAAASVLPSRSARQLARARARARRPSARRQPLTHAALPAVLRPPVSPLCAGAQVSPAYARVAGAMARPSMWAGACLGALAGFMLAYQNSCGRLMGLKVRAAWPSRALVGRTWRSSAHGWRCRAGAAAALLRCCCCRPAVLVAATQHSHPAAAGPRPPPACHPRSPMRRRCGRTAVRERAPASASGRAKS